MTCCGILLRYASQAVTQCFRLVGVHDEYEESLERSQSKPVFYTSYNSRGLSTFKFRPQKISREGYQRMKWAGTKEPLWNIHSPRKEADADAEQLDIECM